MGVKDLENTKGLRTTYGSVIFKDFVPPEDQLIVRSVREAGAIIAGKTNTPEWGAGANTRNAVYGATGNPFDPTKSAAGSSGGSGVALACGMVPIATGSDTGGSLRNPAAFNGIVGFRPSPGLVPSDKRPLGWNPLSVLGPMARTVPDLCLLLSTMVSDDACDPLATTIHGQQVRRAEDFAVPAEIDLAGLKVAITPDFGFTPTEKHIREVFAEKVGLFAHLFGAVDEATRPTAPARTRPSRCCARSPSWPACTNGARHARARRPERARQCRGGAHLFRPRRDARPEAADGSLQELAAVLRPLRCHPVAGGDAEPTALVGALPRRDRRPEDPHLFPLAGQCLRGDDVGHPAISLPVGLDRAGMPFGLQIVGPRGGDAKVLAVAAALERELAGDARTARAPFPISLHSPRHRPSARCRASSASTDNNRLPDGRHGRRSARPFIFNDP